MTDPPTFASLYLEELKSVRGEADRHSDESRITERYILGACGAIYTFLFPQLEKLQSGPRRFIWWLPPFLMIWGGLRSWALYARNRQCRRYLMESEDKLKIHYPDWTGWEHWLADKPHVLTYSALAVWIGGLLATVAIGLWSWRFR
jgi:hypothetical protein